MALGNVEKDIWNLQDVVEVGFDAGAVFEDFVFVARDFESLFT